MKKIIVALFLLLNNQINVFSQSDLYNISEQKITIDYKDTSGLCKHRYDSISYNEAKNQKEFIFEKFNYKSNSLEIEGYLCRPKHIKGIKLPAIIYNRGGTGNFGRLSKEDFPDFYKLAKNGFAVFASNYRYIGKNGKFDQIGGDDINDVINLYKSILKLNYIDRNNIFMMGVSRGGLMTYKSLTKINLNAAAVIGGVANFQESVKKRPIFLNGWNDLSDENNYKGLKNVLPDFETKKGEYLKERSATQWANKINTPVFILHSRQDGRVPVESALQLALKFNEFNKPYKLKVYDKKSHALPYSKFDAFNEIIKWFKAHLKEL